jgi:hypothetical protein
MKSALGTPSRRPRFRKVRNALAALALGVIVSLVAGELVLRLFLFHPKLDCLGLGDKIRRPERYCDGDSDDDYWKFRTLFQDPATIVDATNADPRLGWTSVLVTPGTYEHADEPVINGRKLVLLYGDSFAQCNTPPEECFQSLLERSDLAQEFALLNYGVGGYGLDQIYLLIQSSIDRFRSLDPIVIVGILPESDLERSVLSFRDWPKPRFDLDGDRLVSRGPVETRTLEYLKRHSIGIPSYLWRFLLYHPSRILARTRREWRGDERKLAEKLELNRRILIEIQRELESRGLSHVVLLFHSEQGALEPALPFEKQEKLVRDVCAELSIPLVDTRPYLAFASDGRPVKCAQLFGHGGPLDAHYNAVGNIVCFEAIRQALRGELGEPDFEHLAQLKQRGLFDAGAEHEQKMKLAGRDARVIGHGNKSIVRATESDHPDRVLLRANAGGDTSLVFDVDGGAKRFSGRLHMLKKPEGNCYGVEVGIKVLIEDEVVLDRLVPSVDDAVAIDLDLRGKRRLKFTVQGTGGGAGCEWVCIADPRFE